VREAKAFKAQARYRASRRAEGSAVADVASPFGVCGIGPVRRFDRDMDHKRAASQRPTANPCTAKSNDSAQCRGFRLMPFSIFMEKEEGSSQMCMVGVRTTTCTPFPVAP
jgi:hypothetical protein